MCSSPDRPRYLVDMVLHRLGVGEGHRKTSTNAPLWADCAEEIGAFIALVSGLAWPRATPGPLAHDAVLLADARLILEPYLGPLAPGRGAADAPSTSRRSFFERLHHTGVLLGMM